MCQLQGTTCCIIQRVSGIQKNRHFGNMWSTTKKTYASTVRQNTLPQPKTSNETFSFTAEQLTKFVANVVIQIAQPQFCYPNPKQDTLDLKSSMCCKISNAAKTILNVDITGKICLNQSVLSAPPPPLLPLNPSHSRTPKSTQSPKTSQKHPQW